MLYSCKSQTNATMRQYKEASISDVLTIVEAEELKPLNTGCQSGQLTIPQGEVFVTIEDQDNTRKLLKILNKSTSRKRKHQLNFKKIQSNLNFYHLVNHSLRHKFKPLFSIQFIQ